MDTFEHWPLHIECMRISVYCGSYLQSISTTTATTAHMPHAARRFAHLSRHYTQLGVEVGLLVYFRLLCLYCQTCPMLWLSKRLFSLPFAFQFRHSFFQLFFALSSTIHCRTVPFFRYIALFLTPAHGIQTVFHLALPLWPFYYDFVDFAFPAKNNIRKLELPHAKTEYSARHQSKTVHSRLSKCSRGSLPVDRALDLHK